MIWHRPGEVEAAGKLNEQLYLQMGDGAENYYGLKQLDDPTMELMPYGGRITSGRMPENEKEIIISNGSAAFWNSTDPLGQTATFTVMKSSDMTIVQTVKGEDAVITATESYEAEFLIVGTFERFRASNAPNISEAASILPGGSTAEALYLRLTDGGDFSKRIATLVSEAGLDSVVTVEAHNRYLRWILQGEDAIKYAFIIIFAMLTMAVLLVMMIVIKNSYILSVVEKTDLYGILRCLNASGGQIRQVVIWEGILTWAAAVPFGCIAGAVAMKIIITRAANLGITTLQGLQMKTPLWPFAAALVASFFTMMLSVLSVCKTACAITPVEAFRDNDPFGGSKQKEPSDFSQRLGMTLPSSVLLIVLAAFGNGTGIGFGPFGNKDITLNSNMGNDPPVAALESPAVVTEPTTIPTETPTIATTAPPPPPETKPLRLSHDGINLDMQLYYNENGGNYYHTTDMCSAVGADYLPLTGKLIYEELSLGKFKSLKRFTTCSAPVRPHTH